MLTRLSYSVTFPNTGRTFENQIQFEPGLTAIVGRNEAGKSLVVEMIRYALFGKSALRGVAADYKNLKVVLEFTTLDRDVRIKREPKSEELLVDGVLTSVGTDAVNKAVPNLLGFGLDVFDIALAAMQDELHALTKMAPTARGKMIERLTGMDSLETTEKDCKEKFKSYNTLADTLVISMPQPVAPVEPEGYTPSVILENDLALARDYQSQRNTALAVVKPEAPVEPENPGLDEAEIEANQKLLSSLNTERVHLMQRVSLIPERTVSPEALTKAIAYAEYQEESRRRGPRPSYDADKLHAWEHYHLAGNIVDCPNCGHKFGIRSLTFDINSVPQPVVLSLDQVRAEQAKHARWAEPLPEVEEFIIPDLKKEMVAHERHAEREGLRHQLSEITLPVDRASDLERVRDYNRTWARFDERRQRYETDYALWEEAQAALEILPDKSETIQNLTERLGEARRYERELDSYKVLSAQYIKLVAQVAESREEAEGFKRGAEALKLTRRQVKQELTPSLSIAASAMLGAMTNGERRSIIIDEDFNVFVDGQPLHSLSGSGKSVVNLALRVGLGQVLTAKVLPLFIGDEIDYAMDEDRVGATQETFRNLSKRLDQVILITHKDIEADHIIELR